MNHMKKKGREPLYLYEVAVPIEECWVMRVIARNALEARNMAHAGMGEQQCSISGSTETVERLRQATDEDLGLTQNKKMRHKSVSK